MNHGGNGGQHQCCADCGHVPIGEKTLGRDLFEEINLEGVRGYNLGDKDGGKNNPRGCFKKLVDVEESATYTASEDDDPELLLYIPLHDECKIEGFLVVGEENDTIPKSVKIFVNRNDIAFNNVNRVEPTQVLEIAPDFEGKVQYKATKPLFDNVSSLYVYVKDSCGGEQTRINYFGMLGKAKKHKRQIISAVYEATAAAEEKEETLMDMASNTIT